MNNLKPLKWTQKNLNPLAELELTAYSALHEYVITEPKQGKFEIKKTQLGEPDKKSETMTGFTSAKDAQDEAWAHYQRSMQPYVVPVPSPTKVYELAFDYSDGYFTIFMTTDKKSAIDFIESVKAHDASFIKWHGIDENADEAIIERYEDTHPLKPYASKIFNPIYEDSFSEWACKYIGETFASQLSIIEHELINMQQGE